MLSLSLTMSQFYACFFFSRKLHIEIFETAFNNRVAALDTRSLGWPFFELDIVNYSSKKACFWDQYSSYGSGLRTGLSRSKSLIIKSQCISASKEELSALNIESI